MKKILSLILTFALCFGMLSSAAFAAGSDTVDFTVGSTQICPDEETVTITVKVPQNPGFAAGGFFVVAETLELVDVEIVNGNFSVANEETQMYAFIFDTNIAGGDFINLTFKVGEEGEHDVNLIIDTLYDEKANAVESTVVPGVITIGHTPEIVPGTAPDCDDTGLTDGTKCSVCGKTLEERQEIPANGHVEGETVIENATAATCTQEGSYDEAIYCTACGEELSRTAGTTTWCNCSPTGSWRA